MNEWMCLRAADKDFHLFEDRARSVLLLTLGPPITQTHHAALTKTTNTVHLLFYPHADHGWNYNTRRKQLYNELLHKYILYQIQSESVINLISEPKRACSIDFVHFIWVKA